MINAHTASRRVGPALLTLGLTAFLGTRPAVAEETVAAPSTSLAVTEDPRFHLDVEVDPTAYVFSGYSLHVGLGWKHVRLDLGAFAMAVPGPFRSNDAFHASFNGFGAKLQVFPFAEQRGAFVGVDAGLASQLTELTGTDLAARNRQVTVGVNAGWRFALGQHFYATPWLGVSRVIGARDVTLAGNSYAAQRTVLFPAVHLGYRFK